MAMKESVEMDMYDKMFSPSYILNEQIARQVFETLPECGLVLAILDRDGNCWPSDSEEFAKLDLSETLLGDLRMKIDDGAEPLITQIGETSLTVAQLATDQTNCGYLIIALPRYSPESTLTNLDLVEALFSQITLIAKLIEKTTLLNDTQMRHYRAYGTSGAPAN